MDKYDEVIQRYYALNPDTRIYTNLRRIEIGIEDGAPEAHGDLWLSNQSVLVNYGKLRLTMTNVVLVSPIHGIGINLYIKVIVIHDRQWEGLNYALIELESGKTLFYCKNLEVSIEEG